LTASVGDFQHGTQYKVGKIPGGAFSVYICYEAIFPNEVRRFTLAGAALFVNISTNGWFGGSSAPPQHLAMARVRAVENRRWLLRATNTGITVSWTLTGASSRACRPTFAASSTLLTIFARTMTPYARWGRLAPMAVRGSPRSVFTVVARRGDAFARSAQRERRDAHGH